MAQPCLRHVHSPQCIVRPLHVLLVLYILIISPPGPSFVPFISDAILGFVSKLVENLLDLP